MITPRCAVDETRRDDVEIQFVSWPGSSRPGRLQMLQISSVISAWTCPRF